MLHRKLLHCPASQISPCRRPITYKAYNRCRRGSAREKQIRYPNRKCWRAFSSYSEEILEESHHNPTLSACPSKPTAGNISTSLPEEERLEKLLEAAMKWALDRTQSSLKTVPKSSPETFQKQVEHIHKEWSGLTKSVYDESHRVPSSSTSETDMKRVMENVQKATNRLNEENQSWEALLSKHRNKAEELNRMVEKGQETGIPLDSAAMAQSSVYHVIQNKPNYHDLLCRQRPMLHAMEMIMDTQCKMVRELLSIKEMSTLLLKEASGRLAEEAGFQTLPTDILKNLMSAPPSTAST
ncbi:Kinetochore-associated protein DSN1-like [Oryzias melastigma]|uniref:Kinetochore-associated protein DSN1-like n=1 Tax=Oryzias melastigma TaxID=30732 RepID=A0A834FB95_ORYME|nr:Kinetochore-associated protein DSN1-like [Oryzias melastigma]